MVAPNGARRGRDAHTAIPLTDDDLVSTTLACHAAGADGVHMHIRDDNGLHLLDAGRYRDLLARLSEAAPDLYLQVTSEAAGRYDAATQRALMRDLRPDYVSVALREMVRQDADWAEASDFYAWAAVEGVQIQHIVYAPAELAALIAACEAGRIPGQTHLIQLVLGTYDGTAVSRPQDIAGFTSRMDASEMTFDWMLCAFGPEETECLTQAARMGGKARVGFENSLWNADGSLAVDNAERVREVRSRIDSFN